MNEQNETLIRQSKWNGRRVVLLYWFAIVFIGTSAAAGLGSTILSPKYSFDQFDHSGITDPWHPDDCAQCHDDQVSKWNQTGHYEASRKVNATHVELAGVRNVSQSLFDSSCGHCMATGWDNTTGTVSYWDYGVTCAACHEPGVVNTSAEVCGSCHSGDHHPAYDEYNKSAHPNSYNDMLGSGHAGDSCLHCMSDSGFYDDSVTLDDVSLGIVCSTCHDPHDATNEGQLRKAEINDLCGSCHGTSSRHTTIEMFSDDNNKHKSLDCTSCHGYQLNHTGDDEPGLNHTWAIFLPDACAQCHTADTDIRIGLLEDYQGNTEDLITEVEAQVTNVSAKVDEANASVGNTSGVFDAYALIDEAEGLVLFVESDMSMGFHNPTLAGEKLMLALTKLDQAYAKAVAELEKPAASTPSAGIFLILGSLVGLVLLLRKKKR